MKQLNFTAIIILLLISTALSAFCQTEQSAEPFITLSYDLNDFTISSDDEDATVITTSKFAVAYDESTKRAALPTIAVNVCLPNGVEFQELSLGIKKSKIMQNVIMSSKTMLLKAGKILNQYSDISTTTYDKASVGGDDNILKCTSIKNVGGYTIAFLIVSPFEYNERTKELYFINQIDLFAPSMGLYKANAHMQVDNSDIEMLKNLVENPDYIRTEADVSNSINLNMEEEAKLPQKASFIEKRGYLLITADSLKSSFSGLVDWKTTKGLPVFVETVENIGKKYLEKDIYLRIKQCIYDYWKNKGVQYVLLGGDDDVIPAKKFYVAIMRADTVAADDNIPSDLFYACLDINNFDWDLNKNGIAGEVGDSIDMAQDIYVSRLPVRTKQDVRNATGKIVSYERNPLKYNWENSMLMAGCELVGGTELKAHRWQSDAELIGLSMKYHISKYYNDSIVFYFDTYSDFTGNGDFVFDRQNLQSVLSNQRFHYVDIDTHGDIFGWATETDVYNSEFALALESEQFKLITTIACETNAFDSDENVTGPCLSEAFIRNPLNGVVAYYGCSRAGWLSGFGGDLAGTMGASHWCDEYFYEKLFSENIQTKNLGKVVAYAKNKTVGYCSTNMRYRWLHLGLNPIGDPETPIYTTIPKEFNNVSTKLEKGILTVSIPGVQNYNLSVFKEDGSFRRNLYNCRDSITVGGLPYTYDYVFATGDNQFTICITKQNYKPYLATVLADIYIQNQTINTGRHYIGNNIYVGENVQSSEATGTVEFNSSVKIEAKKIVISDGTKFNSTSDVQLIVK